MVRFKYKGFVSNGITRDSADTQRREFLSQRQPVLINLPMHIFLTLIRLQVSEGISSYSDNDIVNTVVGDWRTSVFSHV